MFQLTKPVAWLIALFMLAACSSSDDAAITDEKAACEELKQVEEAYQQCKDQFNLE